MKRVRATAVVTVTLTLPAPGAWGGDCGTAQIQRQATQAVLEKLKFGAEAISQLIQLGYVKISDPKVKAILVEEDT